MTVPSATSQDPHSAQPRAAASRPSGTLEAYNVLDTAWSGGADPKGAADSTAAFQAALSAIGSAGGGVLYIPTGSYKLTSGLTYAGTAPLRILGDGPQASRIRMASASPSVSYLSITQNGAFGDEKGQDGTVIIESLSFHNDSYSGAFANTNIAVYLSGVNFGKISDVGFYKGSASQRVNQAIVCHACNQVDIDNCNVFAAVNGIVFTGYCQVNNVSNTSVWTPAGTGVPTAACVLYSGQTLTANMENVIFHRGDRGILWTQDAAGAVPHLFFGYNVQPNNHTIACMEFDAGAQVYLTECFFSNARSLIGASVPGLVFGPRFQGSALVEGCQFNGMQGHAISLQAGTGFIVKGCEFGGNSVYKGAANAYDEINIGASAAEVTIDACHFNVNALAGLGTANQPRSAVYTTAGARAVTISNSRGAGAGYGTAALVDNAGTVVRHGCVGLGMPQSTTGAGSTVTTTAPASLSATTTIPAGDMTAGTAYHMRCFGTGTQAAGTAQPLTVGVTIGGTSIGSFAPRALPAAGASFAWTYECLLYVTATGAAGTVAAAETFAWGGNGTGPSTPTMRSGTALPVNTTHANALVLTAAWGATAGSPAITCAATVVERIGDVPSR
jgi:Pectate lyase superfamily protein